ncbi:MAG TPA: NPCBM/NEW2 domain-containing protein [Chitinophagaceae bacterium]
MKLYRIFIAFFLTALFAYPKESDGSGLPPGSKEAREYPSFEKKPVRQPLTLKTVWLSSLDLTKMIQGSGEPVIDKNTDQKPFSIAKQTFNRGVGTRVNSSFWLDLGGASDRFIAYVGVDDDTTRRAYVTTHNFKIIGDGKKLWESGPMNFGDPAKKADIDVKRIKILILQVINTGSRASQVQLDWADARFLVSGRAPKPIYPPQEKAVILTPRPGPEPRINGPKVYGCRPGNPFLYRIPATGKRPIRFSADNLPAGLALDSVTGIISGTIVNRGEYKVMLNAQNDHGRNSRVFRISCGDILALTPPMGWNDWYAHYGRITDKMMREAADIIISSGMADAGYQYVNIDDCWMNAQKNNDPGRVGPARNEQGNILPNSYFPDMKGLTDYIHSRGLKAGIYTSPGPTTCAGYTGSFKHEAQDAKQFADWGFDFLKYDRCSYGGGMGVFTEAMEQKPYRLMGNLLKEQKRDIIFNLCQYGRSEVWKWGAEVGGQSWRTGGDLGFGLDRIFDVALKNAEYGAYSKPGAWNDPDYIQIGYVGNANGGGLPALSRLTPTEQYSFMSLWCLLAAPLIYSGDLTRLDAFTLNVLCNPEVIDVDQDPLGKSAEVIRKTGDSFLMIKELEDGSKAVGLCNSGETPVKVTLKWSDAGIHGKQVVRDLWRQRDLGYFQDEFKAIVPRHGVVLIRISNKVKK